MYVLTSVLNSAATLAAWRGNYARAIDCARQVLRLTDVLGKEMDKVAALEGIGQALLGLGRVEEAVAAVGAIPELVKATTERSDVHHPLVVCAEAHLLLGDVRTAEAILQQAESLSSFNLSWKISVDRLAAQIALANRKPSLAISLAEPWLRKPSEIRFEQARLHGDDHLDANC